MAKLSKRELQSIIERDAPGSKLVATDAAPATDAASDTGTPDLQDLHRKYRASSDAPTVADADDDDDVQIVTIGPKDTADPWDRGAAPKSVVISTKTKRIIGRQG